MLWYKMHELWGSELQSYLEPCPLFVVLGRLKLTTSTINVAYSIPPCGPVRVPIFQGPRWYPYLQPTGLENPAVISQGVGAWSFLKISRNPPTSKISASSGRTVHLSKSFLESVAGDTLRACARVHTDTRTQEPFILDKIHQMRTCEEPGEILGGHVSETIHIQMVFM